MKHLDIFDFDFIFIQLLNIFYRTKLALHSYMFFSCDQAALWMVQSVRLPVRPSVCLSFCCSHHCIIMNVIIANDWCNVYAKGGGEKSKVKVTQVKIQSRNLRTVTPVWIHIWQLNDSQSLMWPKRGVLLYFKVIHQISRSHDCKNHCFLPKFSIFGVLLQFEFTDGYEMMHKA